MPLSDPEQLAQKKADERKDATPVTAAQFDAFEEDRKKISAFRVPDLTKNPVDSGGSNDKTQIKVFTAFFDGTGNDGHKDPSGATNVYYMYTQGLKAVESGHAPHTAVQYIAGPGTGVNNQFTDADREKIAAKRDAVRSEGVPEADRHGGLRGRLDAMTAATANKWQSVSDGVKTSPMVNDNLDLATGWSANSRANTMYQRLCEQTLVWESEAKAKGEGIKVVVSAYGFSRGAETAAVFLNKVEENGIKHPASFLPIAESVDKYGQRDLKFRDNPVDLVAPGKTPQTIGLFDPVGTGHLSKMNRQMPPSVISGVQLSAMDEKRRAFPVSSIIPDEKLGDKKNINGISQDGRFFSLWAPGSHSDVGGSYACNGLSNRSCNMMINYQNALNPALKMQLRDEPDKVDCYIHHSYNGNAIFKAQYMFGAGAVTRDSPGGQDRKINPGDLSEKDPKPMNKELFGGFRESLASNVVYSRGSQLQPESETNRSQSASIRTAPLAAEGGRSAGQSQASSDSMNALFGAATAGDRQQSAKMLHDAINTPLNPAIAARTQGTQERQQAQQAQQAQENAIAPKPQHEATPTSLPPPGRQR